MLLKDLPGYEQAVGRALEREESVRALPFLPRSALIAGVPVLALTPRHFALLYAVRSPLACGRGGDFDDCLQFLWIASPDYLTPSAQITAADVRQTFRAWLARRWPRLRRRKLAPLNRAIRRHLDDALFDRASGGGSDERPIAHLCASLVDEFAAAYGWLPEVLDSRGQPIPGAGILDMPLAALFQYRRCRHQRLDTAHVGNRLSDAVVKKLTQAYVRAQRAKARKGRVQ